MKNTPSDDAYASENDFWWTFIDMLTCWVVSAVDVVTKSQD